MENLNKENFWNELRELYPEAVDHFCKWIDEYKKEVKWLDLFADGIKFHDIPFDMQNGIIARFELELFNNGNGKGKEVAGDILENYKQQVRGLFKDLQRSINRRGVKLN
jgi:hypothetical protein